MQHSQKGVALLTILLLVVSITVVAGSMLASQRVMLRQFVLTKNQDQLREYAIAGEIFASQIIQEDAKITQTDSLQDIWAKPLPPYPVRQGVVEVSIQDNAKFFNINNLYYNGKVDEQALTYFKRLLISQDIEPEIANAILDWQDPDSESIAEGGAEADFYQSANQTTPMPIANQPFLTIDELAYVRGMDNEKLAKLRPFVTAVPFFLPMNINTASPELLMALADGKAMDLANWATARHTSMAIESVEAFWKLPQFSQVPSNEQQAVNHLLDVQSLSFRVLITTKVDNRTHYFISQLAKKQGVVSAFNRQFLAFKPVNWD